MNTTWEHGAGEFVAYLCFPSTLPKMKARRRAAEHTDQMALFAPTAAQVEQEAVETGERVEYLMRLPYTATALKNRLEAGRDVPEWFRLE